MRQDDAKASTRTMRHAHPECMPGRPGMPQFKSASKSTTLGIVAVPACSAMRRIPCCCARATCLSWWIALCALALGLSLGSPKLQAQSLPEGVRWGMSAPELQQVLPSAQRVARPQRLAGGLRGSWQAPADLMGAPGQQTFFFQGEQLQRVEFFVDAREQPDNGTSVYERILSWGRKAYGAERSARDPQNRYATWTLDDTEIYAQHVSAPQASVRLVYKVRQLRDAKEL